MDKEIKQKWLDALRSGKYEQGKRSLCWNNQYCCLGVLAEELGVLVRHPHEPDYKTIAVDDTSCSGNFPPTMQKELGIEDHTRSLISMNDHENKSFTEIADWIEKNV